MKNTNYLTRIALISLLSTLLGLNPTFALVDRTSSSQKNYSLAIDIADHYLTSFPRNVNKEQQETKQRKRRAPSVPLPELDEFTKLNVVFNALFTKSNTFSLLQQLRAPIFNAYVWDDLKLFYGTTSEPSYHLMSRINRTITALGESLLATMLGTPTSNIEELHKRQHIIKIMRDNPTEVDKLRNRLYTYQAIEQNILSFWTKTDPLYSSAYTDYVNRKFYYKKHTLNKSAAMLAFKKRFKRDFLNIGLNFIQPAIFIGINEVFFRGESLKQNRESYPHHIPFYSIFYTLAQEHLDSEERTSRLVGCSINSLMYAWGCYTGVKNYQDYTTILRHLAGRMADIQSFLLTAKQLSDCIAAFPVLEEVYGDRLVSLRKLLDPQKENREFGKLIHYLQQMPSLKSWSYLFNNAGKLLASYKIFLEYKDQFIDAFYEFGQLDVFIAIAQLMQEAQAQSDNAYVFTQFLDRSQKAKPYIKLEDMWNPFIDANKAVPNSIEMDASTGGVRNIILTGPNAGGKSTFLTGVTTALVLSQTLGIAPGKEVVITPFNKINTYINIVDDVTAGKSLFMAEVDRAQKHIKILEDLPKDEFSFSIMDELFTGTNPREGEAAVYSVMEYIGVYDNALNIIATHFPKVMLLEENTEGKNFANYKVFIKRKGPNKKLNYTYKIIPGKSSQTIAIDILESQGYDVKMLERAKDILGNPEKYPAAF